MPHRRHAFTGYRAHGLSDIKAAARLRKGKGYIAVPACSTPKLRCGVVSEWMGASNQEGLMLTWLQQGHAFSQHQADAFAGSHLRQNKADEQG
eukprot:1151813-Pelagomonas_calceolata.AAC.4